VPDIEAVNAIFPALLITGQMKPLNALPDGPPGAGWPESATVL
jgi:hypothetical protein